jgi:glycine cleavage system H protein
MTEAYDHNVRFFYFDGIIHFVETQVRIKIHLANIRRHFMNSPSNLKFTESNEWIKVEGKTCTIGISDYAQDQLSDIVFAEVIVNEGDMVNKGDTVATIESVKAAADVYSPVSGKVIGVNEELGGAPEVINTDPYGAAWILKIELSEPAEADALMDASAYEKFIQEQQ